jgi:hypothetical protein
MLRFFARKSKAVKNWHSRALLIDLRKTKLIIINMEEPDNTFLFAEAPAIDSVEAT